MKQTDIEIETVESRENSELQTILSEEEQQEIITLVRQEQISNKLTQLEISEVATFTQILMSVFNSLTSFLEIPDNVTRFISLLIGITEPNSIVVKMSTKRIAARLGFSLTTIKSYRAATKRFMIDNRLALVDMEAIPNADGTKTKYYRYTLHVLAWIHEIVKATLETGNSGAFSAFLYIQSFDDKTKDRNGKTKREKAFNELSEKTQKAIYEFRSLLESRAQQFTKRQVIIKEDKAAMIAAIQNIEKKIDSIFEEPLTELLPNTVKKTNAINEKITEVKDYEQKLKLLQDELKEIKDFLAEGQSIENLADKEIFFQQNAEGLKYAKVELNELINEQLNEKNEINITTKWRSAELLAKEYLESLEDVLKVEDVSENNEGYDLEVHYKGNSKIYVEVKKVSSFNEPFKLTNNEFACANSYGENYRIALVIDNPFQIRFISNPTTELEFRRVVERISWKFGDYTENLKEEI